MGGLLQPAIEQNEVTGLARQADETLARLRAELSPREFLRAMLHAFRDIQEECRAKEQFYRGRGQLELAMRFDNAVRAATGASIAIQVAFDYEREEGIRKQISSENDAASEGSL